MEKITTTLENKYKNNLALILFTLVITYFFNSSFKSFFRLILSS